MVLIQSETVRLHFCLALAVRESRDASAQPPNPTVQAFREAGVDAFVLYGGSLQSRP